MPGLTSKETLVVVTFARAGLGHMRVAYALLEALPPGTKSTLFSSLDRTTTLMHRVTSVNPALRWLAESLQEGLQERIFTSIYTRVLRLRASALLPQLEAVVKQNRRATRAVFVCTHFGLAHQIGQLKSRLAERSGASIKLVVVVTDDSPQLAWSVAESDLTIVPSKLTGLRLNAPNTKVVHYPLSLRLGEVLDSNKFEDRVAQVDPGGKARIKMSIPVSGAAVGLSFSYELVRELARLEPRLLFYVVSRRSAYTDSFLRQMEARPGVRIYTHEHDRLVVSKYIKMMHMNNIAVEVTKPSEQAFKALYTPKQIGGVILLFTNPVGRQEWDNLDYLKRNNMIPSDKDQNELWQLAFNQKPLARSLKLRAKSWRGMRLPRGYNESALYIVWCLREGVLAEMVSYSGKPRSSGAVDVWRAVDSLK